jgi:hypothetical protein
VRRLCVVVATVTLTRLLHACDQNLPGWRHTQSAIALEYIWHVVFGEHWWVTEPIRNVQYANAAPSASPLPEPDTVAEDTTGATTTRASSTAVGPPADVINGTLLVVARNPKSLADSVEWLRYQPYRFLPITFGQPEGTPNNVPFDKGREASAYLRYILDYWDDLPPRVIFIHNHNESWHVDRGFGVRITAMWSCIRRTLCSVCRRDADVGVLCYSRAVCPSACAVAVCDASSSRPTVVRVRVAEL